MNLKQLRTHLSYANVVATIALVLVIGGAGAYAATHLKKNSVTSKAIKDGNVKSKDLADGAVTTPKLSDSAVTTAKIAADAVTTAKIAADAVTSSEIADNAVTGADVAADTLVGDDIVENSLRFGCTDPLGNAVTFQMPGGGFCALFRNDGANNKTWAGSVDLCNQPDSTLPTPAEFAQLAAATGSVIPAALTAFWSSDAAAGGAGTSAAWVVTTDTGGVTRFDPLVISNTVSIDDLVCVYQPASKNG